MSSLSAFLNPLPVSEKKEVVISKRFVKRDEKGQPLLDENGKMIPEPFVIRALTQEENDALVKAATKVEVKNGHRMDYLDNVEYNRRVIVAATVFPDFTSKELCDALGVVSPLLAPGKMLRTGEYNRLMDEVASMAGLMDDDMEEEVKN